MTGLNMLTMFSRTSFCRSSLTFVYIFFVFILASSLFSLLADESPTVHAAGLGELKIVVASLQPEQLADLTPDVRQVSSFFCLLTSVSYASYITAHLLYQPTTD